MKTLETKIKNGKFLFYVRTWDGIDHPEYDFISSLNIKAALNLIKELQDFVENSKKNIQIQIKPDVFVNLEEAKTIREKIDSKLQEYGE